jgi:hypothetical protein
MAEQNQPPPRDPYSIEAALEPERPPDMPVRYAQGVGDYVSETKAAAKNDKMINREYHEHERKVQQAIEEHTDKKANDRGQEGPHSNEPAQEQVNTEHQVEAPADHTPARDLLEQYMQGKHEVNKPTLDRTRSQDLER